LQLLWEGDESERVASASSGRIGPIDGDAVSAPGSALVLASYRGGSTYAPPYETILIVALIAVMAVACFAIFRHLADQWQAHAVMGELCPHGWQAEITLYGWGAPVPEDAPPSRVPLVELEWKQFAEEAGRVAVARRVWAPTISEALQTMVEDRRTDLTLEQIEQEASDQGDIWWTD
jgi:hypothetical protein